MSKIDLSVEQVAEKILPIMAKTITDIENLVFLYASRDGIQARNRANISAHIAYTKRKGKAV